MSSVQRVGFMFNDSGADSDEAAEQPVREVQCSCPRVLWQWGLDASKSKIHHSVSTPSKITAAANSYCITKEQRNSSCRVYPAASAAYHINPCPLGFDISVINNGLKCDRPMLLPVGRCHQRLPGTAAGPHTAGQQQDCLAAGLGAAGCRRV